MSYRPGLIVGTRPEAIKVVPLIPAFKAADADPVLIVTGQHTDLLAPILSFFEVTPDVHLTSMVPGQSLAELNATLLRELDCVLPTLNLDSIIVQGDTTSAMAGATVGFYRKINVIHVEAGLRTDDLYAPFPEEFNRRVIDQVAHVKFPPTPLTFDRLVSEGLWDRSIMVGNTVIDALLLGLRLIQERGTAPYLQWMHEIGSDRSLRRVLVTTHRRENAGQSLVNICDALIQIIETHDDLEIVLPVHRNPEFYDTIHRRLGSTRRIVLTEPLPYDRLIWMMSQSAVVLTDSGGLQEEAPALNIPVLVMRDVTERPEGVSAGCAKLVGTDTSTIVRSVTQLLTDKNAYKTMAESPNPYGDGTSCHQIVSYLLSQFNNEG